MKYYVYHLIDPRDSLPFYVGKGSGDRMYRHVKEAKIGNDLKNPHKYNKIQQILNEGLSVEYLKVHHTEYENESYQKETSEISRLKSLGIKLCNILPGGVGGSGIFSNPKERSQKISNARRGKKMSKWHYEAMKPVWEKARCANLGSHRSESTRHILSLQKLGNKNPAKRSDVREKIANTIRTSGICRGENNPSALFTYDDIKSIRNDWNNTSLTILELSRKYGCKKPTIEKIVQNRNYYDPTWIRKVKRRWTPATKE